MSTIRFSSKKDFVAALEARRKFWRDYDSERTREHHAAEQAFLRDARARMREALKLPYPDLKALLRYDYSLPLGDKPDQCPRRQEKSLDQVLAALKLTSSNVFSVEDGRGAWQIAHYLLTADPRAKSTVC